MAKRKRFQRGSLSRKKGMWTFRYSAKRASDGRLTERSKVICPATFSKSHAERLVNESGLIEQINSPALQTQTTFSELANHYLANVIQDRAESTQGLHKQLIKTYLLPRWGREVAVEIEPLEIERWLQSLKRERQLANPTLFKIKTMMGLLYKSGQKYKLIPRKDEANPVKLVSCSTKSDYEAKILTPQQTLSLLSLLHFPEYVLTLLICVTGLRISEALGLQWWDVLYDKNEIKIRRGFVYGTVGDTKTSASKASVPMHPLLAEVMKRWQSQTPYGKGNDWVFASVKLGGKKPRNSTMLVQDYLRPAAVKAGIISKNEPRFGFHNLRHSLTSFLIKEGQNPKLVQTILRWTNMDMVLYYTHAQQDEKLQAQGTMLEKLLNQKSSSAVQ